MSVLFNQLCGRKVSIEVPQRGERLRLVERAEMNASEEILRATTVQQRRTNTLIWLQKSLELPEYPERIEAFDVSNLGDTGIVAAMTVHKDGKPYKKDYRKFRIRDLDIRDDYASMTQAVYRRFAHLKNGDSGFSGSAAAAAYRRRYNTRRSGRACARRAWYKRAGIRHGKG